MAISASTLMSGFSGYLNPEQLGAVFEKTAKTSIVQNLGTRVPLGIAGQTVPVVTGRMSAGWVDEGAQKPASQATMSLLTMTPKKIAAIAVVSMEVARANPGGIMQVITNSIAEAFAVAFDAACLHGTSTPFATYLDQTSKAVEMNPGAVGDTYQSLVNALRLLVADGKRLTGWALDDILEPSLLSDTDTTKRPIYLETPYAETAGFASPANENPSVRLGRLIGRPSAMGPTVATTNLSTVVGYGGDWSKVVWGQIGGIEYTTSSEAATTINGTLVSLFERNLIAIRAETEFGFLCGDVQSFVRLTNASGS